MDVGKNNRRTQIDGMRRLCAEQRRSLLDLGAGASGSHVDPRGAFSARQVGARAAHPQRPCAPAGAPLLRRRPRADRPVTSAPRRRRARECRLRASACRRRGKHRCRAPSSSRVPCRRSSTHVYRGSTATTSSSTRIAPRSSVLNGEVVVRAHRADLVAGRADALRFVISVHGQVLRADEEQGRCHGRRRNRRMHVVSNDTEQSRASPRKRRPDMRWFIAACVDRCSPGCGHRASRRSTRGGGGTAGARSAPVRSSHDRRARPARRGGAGAAAAHGAADTTGGAVVAGARAEAGPGLRRQRTV